MSGEKVVIFGNQSVARLIYKELTHNSPHEVVAFCVDPDFIDDSELFDLPVVPFGDVTSLYPPEEHRMFVAVGYTKLNQIRENRYLQAKAWGYRFVNAIAKTAVTYPCLEIGENCYIGNYTVIYPDVRVGNNVLIGSSCTLDHNLSLGNNCFLSDQVAIAGYVTVKDNCFLGTNCTIRNKVIIGREAIIGAATNIMEDVEERSVYLCDPSKKLRVTSNSLKIV